VEQLCTTLVRPVSGRQLTDWPVLPVLTPLLVANGSQSGRTGPHGGDRCQGPLPVS
jgi:hypothetical protein